MIQVGEELHRFRWIIVQDIRFTILVPIFKKYLTNFRTFNFMSNTFLNIQLFCVISVARETFFGVKEPIGQKIWSSKTCKTLFNTISKVQHQTCNLKKNNNKKNKNKNYSPKTNMPQYTRGSMHNTHTYTSIHMDSPSPIIEMKELLNYFNLVSKTRWSSGSRDMAPVACIWKGFSATESQK